MDAESLAFAWQLSEMHGWGLVGVHVSLYLVERGDTPLPLLPPVWSAIRPKNRERLFPRLDEAHRRFTALIEPYPEGTLRLSGHTVMHCLGNGLLAGQTSARFQGQRNIGILAVEDTRFDDAIRKRGRLYDTLITLSTYNQQLLLDQGFDNAVLAIQGIDPEEMAPRKPSFQFGDRFVVFSGGKFEYRKGQDIVLAAFRIFRQRHPEALLVTAWQNLWPEQVASMADSPHVDSVPETTDNGWLKFTPWAAAHGVPADSFIDLGFVPRERLASVLADCHAAVFPNRCEGGTNLVAMEAMACGVPVVLSANTGHLDIIRPDTCLELTRQTPPPDPDGRRLGWGESSVDELVECLEAIHADRDAARVRAMRALVFMRTELPWRRFAQTVAHAVG
jgi:glycosyltransferase involved in cell wall biosynthesis